MPDQKRYLKVFLCHASGDKDKVHPLYKYLVRRGVDAWLDTEKLLPGQNWPSEIARALEASDVIIICLSKESVDKEGYVQKEIKFALDRALEMPEGRIFLIPARLEECQIPHSLSDYQWVDLFGGSDGFNKLLRALNVRAEQVGCAPAQMFRELPGWLNPITQPVSRPPAGGEKPGDSPVKVDSGETEKPLWKKTEVIAATIGAVATLAAALIGLTPGPEAAPTPTRTAMATETVVPPSQTLTATPTATPTARPSQTASSTPTPQPTASETPGFTSTPSLSPTPTLPPERLISVSFRNLSPLQPAQRFLSAVHSVDISPDNRWIASGERNGRVTISVAPDLALFKQFDYERVVNAVTFSPNGRWLAVAGEGGQIMVIDAFTWGKPIFITGHADTINALDFSHDSSLLVSGGLGGALRLWDVPTFSARNVINTSRRIYALDVDPSGGQVAVGASDGIVRVWHTNGQRAYELASSSGPSQSVIGLQFSPGGDFLAAASSDPDHPYVLWDVQTGKVHLEFGSGLNARGVSFSPDGQVLVTNTKDRQLAIWRTFNGSQLFYFDNAHQGEIWAAAISRDGTLIVTSSDDKTVQLWGIP